jgi:hypothetical protein
MLTEKIIMTQNLVTLPLPLVPFRFCLDFDRNIYQKEKCLVEFPSLLEQSSYAGRVQFTKAK